VNISKLKNYYKRISPKIAEIQPELITIKDEPEDYVENLEENNRFDKSKENTKRKYIKKKDDINISGKQLSKKGKAKSIEKRKSTAIINSKFKGKKKKNTSALVNQDYTGTKGRLRSGNLKVPTESKNLLNIHSKDPPHY
jgi:Zn-dependent oligopeptidase